VPSPIKKNLCEGREGANHTFGEKEKVAFKKTAQTVTVDGTAKGVVWRDCRHATEEAMGNLSWGTKVVAQRKGGGGVMQGFCGNIYQESQKKKTGKKGK